MNLRNGFWASGVALLVYALLAAVLIVHGASLRTEISGTGSDPFDSVWFLSWFPYALTHHVDPFFTRAIWYPTGVSLLWVTSVPLLAVLGWPVTAVFGPVVAYNLWIVTAPVFGAWCAFWLCRYIARDFFAALIGGFIFGFSTYETAQSLGALNLSIICLVPCAVLVVLLRLDERISRSAVVALTALILLAAFLVCIEIFAMMFVFGGIAWALALMYLPERRPALRRLFFDGLWTAPFVMLPLVPLLVAMARHYALISHPGAWPYVFVADFFGLFVPSSGNLFGGAVAGVAKHFASVPQEQDAYIGLPLLVLVVLFASQEGRRPQGRFLLACVLVFILLSFGPRLWVLGKFTAVVMPWALLMHLPMLGAALPVRFAMFSSLVCACIAAIFLARPGRRGWRFALGILACVALLPAPHPWRAVPTLRFFAPGRVQAALGCQNPKLILLPFSRHGPSSLWQAEQDFGFTEVGGYLGFPPAPEQKFKAVNALFAGVYDAGFGADFSSYATQTGAQYVVAGPGTDAALMGHLAALGWVVRKIDDVTVYTVPASSSNTVPAP